MLFCKPIHGIYSVFKLLAYCIFLDQDLNILKFHECEAKGKIQLLDVITCNAASTIYIASPSVSRTDDSPNNITITGINHIPMTVTFITAHSPLIQWRYNASINICIPICSYCLSSLYSLVPFSLNYLPFRALNLPF